MINNVGIRCLLQFDQFGRVTTYRSFNSTFE